MGNGSESPHELWTKKHWVPLVGITGYVSYVLALVVRQLRGMQFVPKTMGIVSKISFYKKLWRSSNKIGSIWFWLR